MRKMKLMSALLCAAMLLQPMSAWARTGSFTDYITNFTDDATGGGSMRHICQSANVAVAKYDYNSEFVTKKTDLYGRYRETRLKVDNDTLGQSTVGSTYVVYHMAHDITAFDIKSCYITYGSGNLFCDDLTFYVSADGEAYQKVEDYERAEITYGDVPAAEKIAQLIADKTISDKAGQFCKIRFSADDIPEGMRYLKIVWPKIRSKISNAVTIEAVSVNYNVPREEVTKTFKANASYKDELYSWKGITGGMESKNLILNNGENFRDYVIYPSNGSNGNGDVYVVYQMPQIDSFELETYLSAGTKSPYYVQDFTFEVSSDAETWTPYEACKTIVDDTGRYLTGSSGTVANAMPWADFRPAYDSTMSSKRVQYKTIYTSERPMAGSNGTSTLPEGTRYLKVNFGEDRGSKGRGRIISATLRYAVAHPEITAIDVSAWENNKIPVYLDTDINVSGAKLLVALYKEGSLIGCGVKEVSIVPGNAPVSVDIERPESLTDYNMKAFLWRDGSLEPLADAYRIADLNAALDE